LKDRIVLSNTAFDTTRANIEDLGGCAIDIPTPEALTPSQLAPFKGNIDLQRLEQQLVEQEAGRIACVILTITNNSGGGQPASMANIRGASQLCRAHGVPFYLDACRFAENAYFIKLREPGYSDRTPESIAREIFSLADGATFSAKKDGLANIGGFLASNDDRLAQQEEALLVLTEGFPTYGGMAGRDLEAIAVGLREVTEEAYLHYRIASTAYLGNGLVEAGMPIVQPPGGHAIYIDAGAFLPHIAPEEFPGQALACALYEEGGVRSVEIGTLMFGGTDPRTGQKRRVPPGAAPACDPTARVHPEPHRLRHRGRGTRRAAARILARVADRRRACSAAQLHRAPGPLRTSRCGLGKLNQNLLGISEDDVGILLAVQRLRGTRHGVLEVALQFGGEYAAIVVQVRIARDPLEQVVAEDPWPCSSSELTIWPREPAEKTESPEGTRATCSMNSGRALSRRATPSRERPLKHASRNRVVLRAPSDPSIPISLSNEKAVWRR
jgi:hypothetical protein